MLGRSIKRVIKIKSQPGKVVKIKSRIFEAKPDDKYKGWIRVSNDLRKDIPNRAYVKVIANNRRVYCQIRGTQRKAERVEMNEWYRNALGWTDPPKEEVELTIKEVGFFGRIGALAHHPDDIVRVGAALGMISVGLGLLSVILAISITEIVSLVIGVVLVLVALFPVGVGVVILLGRFPKPIKQKDSC